MKPRTANRAWLQHMSNVLSQGEPINGTREKINGSVWFNMNYPIVNERSRKINYKFMAAEALYIIQGRSDVRDLTSVLSQFDNYTDLYPFQQGSYGPPFVEQIRYVVDTLKENRLSRQAVMTIWRPNPRKSKDIPCTLSLQFLIRENKLNCLVTMRSSDVFTGLIYDMFCFSMMALVVANYTGIGLGKCWITAGSSHVYDKDVDQANLILSEAAEYDGLEYELGTVAPQFYGNNRLKAAKNADTQRRAREILMGADYEGS